MQSKAATVKDYLASLPPERREVVEHVRKIVNDNLDKDYREGMQYGMIGWAVPHEVFPDGYHCDPSQPLTFAGLAAQKTAYSLYLMCIYGHEGERAWFESAWKKTGKKLDAGKACIRFKKVEDLALDVIAEAVRRVPAKKYVEHYVKSREAHAAGKAKPAKKTPAKSAGAVQAKKKVVAKKVIKAKGK